MILNCLDYIFLSTKKKINTHKLFILSLTKGWCIKQLLRDAVWFVEEWRSEPWYVIDQIAFKFSRNAKAAGSSVQLFRLFQLSS